MYVIPSGKYQETADRAAARRVEGPWWHVVDGSWVAGDRGSERFGWEQIVLRECKAGLPTIERRGTGA